MLTLTPLSPPSLPPPTSDHMVVPGVMNSLGLSRSPIRFGLASRLPGVARTCRQSGDLSLVQIIETLGYDWLES